MNFLSNMKNLRYLYAISGGYFFNGWVGNLTAQFILENSDIHLHSFIHGGFVHQISLSS